MLDAKEGFDPFARSAPQPYGFAAMRKLQVSLYTDAHVIRGVIETRMRRLSDVLNEPEHDFVVVSDAVMEEFGAKDQPVTRAEYAQVNLNSLLFAVTDSIVEPQPELRLVKSPENALVVVPPFKIVGRIHVLPDRSLRDALQQLTGRFVAVTDACYWSDSLREPKAATPFIAFNHDRAHVLASHREADPWAGIAGS